MTLSLTELEAVVADLKDTVLDASFSNFRQIDETAAILVMSTPTGPRFVRITAAPRVSRLHLTGTRPPQTRGATGFSFEGRVFRELKETVLSQIRTVFHDRVVMLVFEGKSHKRKLIFECSGHHPNLFLTDDREEILAMMLPSHSHLRELRLGRRYARPLKVETEPFDSFRFASGAGAGDLSTRIETAYALEATREADTALATRIRQRLRVLLDADQRLVEGLRNELARSVEATQAQTPDIENESTARGARKADAGGAIQARLDAVLPRIGRTEAAIMALLEGAPDALSQGETLLADLVGTGRASPAFGRRDPASAASGSGDSSGPGGTPFAERPLATGGSDSRHREFKTRAGNPILVASDPRDNEELTFRTAGDDDLWFQVEGGGGAHVLLPGARDDRPFEELLDAAILAVQFSGADPRQEVAVVCTHRRNLRPEGRSPEPGAVRIVRAQTIRVRPDAARLRRLLETESLSRRPLGDRPPARRSGGPSDRPPKRAESPAPRFPREGAKGPLREPKGVRRTVKGAGRPPERK